MHPFRFFLWLLWGVTRLVLAGSGLLWMKFGDSHHRFLDNLGHNFWVFPVSVIALIVLFLPDINAEATRGRAGRNLTAGDGQWENEFDDDAMRKRDSENEYDHFDPMRPGTAAYEAHNYGGPLDPVHTNDVW